MSKSNVLPTTESQVESLQRALAKAQHAMQVRSALIDIAVAREVTIAEQSHSIGELTRELREAHGKANREEVLATGITDDFLAVTKKLAASEAARIAAETERDVEARKREGLRQSIERSDAAEVNFLEAVGAEDLILAQSKFAKLLERASIAESSLASAEKKVSELCEISNAAISTRASAELALAGAPHATDCAYKLSASCIYDCPGCIQQSSSLRFGERIPHIPRERKPCDCWKSKLPAPGPLEPHPDTKRLEALIAIVTGSHNQNVKIDSGISNGDEWSIGYYTKNEHVWIEGNTLREAIDAWKQPAAPPLPAKEWRCRCSLQMPRLAAKTEDGYLRCEVCKRVWSVAGELVEGAPAPPPEPSDKERIAGLKSAIDLGMAADDEREEFRPEEKVKGGDAN